MNFEYIQNINCFKKLYPSCKDAEELALSKPYLSMTACRKSAEALARFIYFIAYKEQAEFMSFSEILADPVVQKHIGNRAVLNAFNNIRKNGNRAVHGEEEKTEEQAIDLLKNLHYVVGETAQKQKLIKSYPHFNENIVKDLNSSFHDFDPVQLAKEMYEINVAKYRVEQLQNEYYKLLSPFKIVPGNVELTEFLEVETQKISDLFLTHIQEYYGFLAISALKNRCCREDFENDIVFDVELIVYSPVPQIITDPFNFIDFLMGKLKDCNYFVLKSTYNGQAFAGMINDEMKLPFFNKIDLTSIPECEDVKYKGFEYLWNHGETECVKFDKGKFIDIGKQFTKNIIFEKDYGNWWTDNINIYVKFNDQQHKAELERIKNLTWDAIPEDERENCEELGDEQNQNGLSINIQWMVDRLSYVQDFLDSINEIILPIKNDCKCFACGYWYDIEDIKAVAKIEWTDDGFIITGTEL